MARKSCIPNLEFLRSQKSRALSVSDMMKALNCSEKTVYNRERKGQIPASVKSISGCRVWYGADVLNFFEQKFREAVRA